MNPVINSNKSYLRFIVVVSIIVPVAVAVLLFFPLNFSVDDQSWIKTLPAFNAVINSGTAVLLLAALLAVLRGKIMLHRNLMTTALILGSIFLMSYIVYHASSTSTVYGDLNGDGTLSVEERAELGSMRTIYLFTLLSHIALSIVVVPFVLLAFYYALSGQVARHRKIVKFTFPIWLYVSVTGVIVYLMISPYYGL